MPAIDNSQLDDQPVLDADNAFLGGQVSASDEANIPKGAYAEGMNMDFDPFGRLQTRRGARTTTGNAEVNKWDEIATNWDSLTTYWGTTLSSTAIDGAFFYDTYASEYMIIAQGGALLQGTESSIYAAIGSASYSGSTIYFGQLNNRLYYCDGVGALKYIDSTLTHNAITAGKVSSIKITTEGIGYNAAPAITFTHNGGASGAATSVLGYGGKVVAATVTTAGSGYSATTPPTIAFAAAPAGGTTAAGIVNITQLPSKPAYLVSHKNRLFCTSADTSIPPDTVYASDILDGESWDLVGASVRVGGDGDPITGLYPWFGNNLIVFKQRSIWVIDADPLLSPADWEITLINNRIGCVSHRSIQAVGADVYFLAQDGVRSLAQIQAGTQTEVGQPLSAPIQDEIDDINKSVMSTICSAFYRNRYFLAIPTGSNTTPNRVLVWNELSKSWLGAWTGWTPRDFVVSGFSGRIRLNFADNAGKLWTWDDFTPKDDETLSQYRDDTTAYESYVITRAYSHGEPLVNKLGHSVHMFTENNLTDGSQTNYLYYDKDLSGSFTALDTAITVASGDKFHRVAKNLISKGRFNVIQFKAGATTGKFTLSGIATTALPDTLQLEVAG